MISRVLDEAWDVYRRIWQRSVLVAGLVFLVVNLAAALVGRTNPAHQSASRTLLELLLSLLLALIGGLLVQGALVEVVRDLHEGRQPGSIGSYYDRTRGRLGTLLGAAIRYGIGVGIGFLLLIVPGLIAIARWSLSVPLVMIEGCSVGEAFSRSSALVKGRTGQVLVLLIVAELITGVSSAVIQAVFGFLPAFWAIWIGGTIAGALTVPYTAHVLTVLYYRLTEPDRRVLPEKPPRETWRSVWDEEPPA